jgi:NAD(P)-dependent dehydrogenase (short-subunit alcohol dehydrogenase family)
MASTYLITGASRGLGAEFARQLRERGHASSPPCGSEKAGDVARGGAKVVQLDVDRPDTFDAFARTLDVPVDVLVNNAGIAAGDASLQSVASDTMERVFRTNVFGPALLTRALMPFLRRGRRKTVVNVSSSLGSLASTAGDSPTRIARASGAQHVDRAHACRASADGFTIVSLDPGWNRTDMGDGGAARSVDTVRSMVAILDRLGPADSGRFLGHDDEPRPW